MEAQAQVEVANMEKKPEPPGGSTEYRTNAGAFGNCNRDDYCIL